MKRDELKALGITEDATIDAILNMNSRDIGVEVNKTESATAAKKELEAEIAKRDADLATLKTKAAGNEELTKQVSDLQAAATLAKAEYEKNLQAAHMSAAIKYALTDKVHDLSIVSGLIDTSKIELNDNGEVIKGLDTQIEALQKDKGFLFIDQKSAPQPKAAGWKPAEASTQIASATGDYESKYAAAKTSIERIQVKQEAAANGVFLS